MIDCAEFQVKHGTAERWLMCRCHECVTAGVAAGECKPFTDAEKVNAYLATIPGGEAGDWFKIADAGRSLMRDLQNRGDGTVNAKSWGHLRNIAEAIKHLAFVLSSAERGDDPDIPF